MRVASRAIIGLARPLRAAVGTAIAQTGHGVVRGVGAAGYIVAVIWAALWLATLPSSWTRAVRNVFARQLLFTGVDGLLVALRVGAAVGIVLIVETALWIEAFGGGTEMVTPLLVKAIIRELAPLIAGLVVVGRSGAAIATELANMRVRGELEVLDAQGIDPMTYLVMPRLLGVPISVFCLGVVIILAMFASGYLVGVLMGAIHADPGTFFTGVLREFTWEDAIFFVPKTLITGLFVGAICAVQGLSVRGAATDVPLVASRSGVKAMTAIFAVSAVLSLIIYGRVLIFQVI